MTRQDLPSFFWLLLVVDAISCATLISRRLWLVVHQRGLEWSRTDEGLERLWMLNWLVSFATLFVIDHTARQ